MSDSRDRLKAAKRVSDKCREEMKDMRERESLVNGEREAAEKELVRERERWSRERKETRRAKSREVAAARAEIEEEAKTMIGETMRAALREVERLSMLCREQKNEISSLRRRLAERSAVQDLEAAAEALSPDRRMGEVLSSSSSSSSAAVLTEAFLSHQITMEDDTDAMSRTARSVNESLRGLTREDLSETTTTTMTEFDDAAEAVMARLWALASFYFREADRNNNGLLTHTEIRLFLRQHLDEKRKFGVHEFGWRGLWAAMDKNKDGQTDEHEWCQFFVKAVSPFSYAWPGESAQKSARKVGSREGGNKASSSSSSRKKRNNRGSRLKDRKGGKARGIKNKKVRMKLSPKVSPYAAQPATKHEAGRPVRYSAHASERQEWSSK